MMMTLQDKVPSYDVPSRQEALSHLLQSIALEEEALSRLLNAEADKALAFVGKNLDFPNKPSNDEIITFNRTVISILDSVLMAEWLLFKKLDAAIHMYPVALKANFEMEESNSGDELDDITIDY
ncbi:hypothetical protein ACFYU8_29395 [Brevibacillus sp. NPDC003359]|uniref:hypothetical protein n=1 Tax=unclassified Brevibacillus TaxID=2684853 RepID=UPI0036AF2080